jgi:predicted peptidase
MPPENYDPARRYPLVLALHGVSQQVYVPMYLAQPEFRKLYPAFVVVPLSAKRSFWAMPENKNYRLATKGPRFPDSLPQAMQVMNKVIRRYNIDTSRLYITGSSMGAFGVYGSLKQYPDTFAAALAVAGLWDPNDAPYMLGTPLLAINGSADRQVVPQITEELVFYIRELGSNAFYHEIEGAGHAIWPYVYNDKATWDWLFSHRKGS